ncbi:hypothetical protein ACHWQZ_G016786 [Mnemiopsis leidyi]
MEDVTLLMTEESDGVTSGVTTIVIELQDNDTILASATLLTTHSTVFRHLILNLNQTTVRLTDFTPEIVIIFVTLLVDGEMGDNIIDTGIFRELHKLSTVFNVVWMVEACRGWFKKKVEDVTDYDSKLYVVEECRYIKKTWFGLSKETKLELDNLVNSYLFALSQKDNTRFIKRYTDKIDTMETDQLDLLVRIAGEKSEVLIGILFDHLSLSQSLDRNSKYLLQHLNLSQCYICNRDLFHRLFQTISDLKEILCEDTKEMFTLLVKVSSAGCSTILDLKEWYRLHKECTSLDHLLSQVEIFRIRSLFAVVDLLVGVVYQDPPTEDDGMEFLRKLANLTKVRPLGRVSESYINLVTTAVRCSTKHNKDKLIWIMEEIRDMEEFTAKDEHEELVGELIQPQGETTNGPASLHKLYGRKNLIRFSYNSQPSRSCFQEGRCGFIVQHAPLDSNIIHLCREKYQYSNSGVHSHHGFKAEDLWYYVIINGITAGGIEVRVPGVWVLSQWDWWAQWLPCLQNCTLERFCVQINVKGVAENFLSVL